MLAWAIQNPNLKDGDKALFDSVSQDLGDTVPKGPEGEPDSKKFTVTFKAPDPDWEIQTWMVSPAHVVAKQGGMSTEEMVEAVRNGDGKALKKAAEFWNTGWNTDPGKLPDEALIPSSGPYKLDSWQAGESVTWWPTRTTTALRQRPRTSPSASPPTTPWCSRWRTRT